MTHVQMGPLGAGAAPAGRPRVTVVVPTRNSCRTLEACLRSLREQTYPCWVVVVDNASTDDTWTIAARWAHAAFSGGPERSAQRNVGARRFPADVVGFIDSDMVLSPEVVEQVVAGIAGGSGAVIVPERTVGYGFWVRVRAFERGFYDGADNIEAARFYRWDVFESAGGFDEELTGPEDIDLTQEARRYTSVTRIKAHIDHDEGNLRFFEACRKKAYYAPGLRRYVAKRGGAALRDATNRPWLCRPWQLLSLHGAGLLALKAGEMTAVGWELVKDSAKLGGVSRATAARQPGERRAP